MQPFDSFIIQSIKNVWRKRGNENKLHLARANVWTEGSCLPNSGKAIFLRLVTQSVADANAQGDKNGLTYPFEAMILCGMTLNTNDKWEECQLDPELQNIIKKHWQLFKNPDELKLF